MTLAVVLALLRPLLMGRVGGAGRDISNVQVYRDQLAEIDSDRERGLINDGEAEAAKLEIQRRLLVSEQHVRAAAADARPRLLERSMMIVIGVCLPALAFGLYLHYGSPNVPDEPLLARLKQPVSAKNVPELIARVEQRLRNHPNDGEGWEVIAPIYVSVGRFGDAINAFKRAITLLGPSPKLLAGLGEAEVLGNNGIVSDQARAVLQRAAKLDPSLLKPHVLLALGAEQIGNYKQAIAQWKTLRGKVKTKRWEQLVAQKIAANTARLEGKPVPNAAASPAAGAKQGPTEQDVAAAQKMTPQARQAMIETMVGRLAHRLDQNGNDLDGWMKLVKAYVVLNRKDDARAALKKAKVQFSGNATALSRLNALANELGLKS